MVDLVYLHLPGRVQRVVSVFSDVLMFAAWVILTWRLGIAVADKFGEHETTFILQIPLWIPHAVGFAGAVVGCVVYLAKTLAEIGWIDNPDQGEGGLPAGGHA
jgi:TRAP-type C4-dicarboxylate transport system permease small subunit